MSLFIYLMCIRNSAYVCNVWFHVILRAIVTFVCVLERIAIVIVVAILAVVDVVIVQFC